MFVSGSRSMSYARCNIRSDKPEEGNAMGMKQIVRRLTSIAGDLEAEFDVCRDEQTAETIAVVLAAIRTARRELGEWEHEVEKALLAEMSEPMFVVEGIGQVKSQASKRRTGWDHDRLIAAIVGRVADEPDVFWNTITGEQLPPATVVHNVARRLRECVSFGAGKVTGLTQIGLDPGEFCTEDEAHWSVTLPGAKL